MKKIERSAYPLGDKEYNETEWASGNLKEKFQIAPQGVIYIWVTWIGNEKKVTKINIWDKILYTEKK
jgi:hypothetical protein